MHFVHFDVCQNGEWKGKSCDIGQLFWAVINCCIPLNRYPTFENCVLTEEERAAKEKLENAYRSRTVAPCDKNKTLIDGLVASVKKEDGVEEIPHIPKRTQR